MQEKERKRKRWRWVKRGRQMSRDRAEEGTQQNMDPASIPI